MGLVAALAGMMFYAVASVAQGYAASRASGPAVLRHPAYLAGLACDGLAWVASVVALTRMPMFAVESLLAGSLAVTVLLAAVVLRARPSARDWVAIGVVTVGLVLVASAAGSESATRPPSWYAGSVVALAVAAVVALAALYPRGSSLPLAFVAGVGFSGVALGARAVEVSSSALTAATAEVLRQPAAWMVLVLGVVGAVAYARALERGPLGPATAVMWVVEVLLPGATGVFVLGDTVRHGWAIAAVLGVAVSIAGCIVLALSPVQETASG